MSTVDSVYGLYPTTGSTDSTYLNSSQMISMSDFFEIFLVQLENQDPTDTVDTSEMTSQLCSYSQLGQAMLTNEYLSVQSEYLQSAFAAGAAQLIGRTVAVEGNSLTQTGDGAPIFLELESALSEATITVYDEDGNQVDQFTAENLSLGRNTIGWDGKNEDGEVLPDGEYTYEVEPAVDYGGEIQTFSSLQVLSVIFLNGGAYLQTSSGLQISYTEVSQVM